MKVSFNSYDACREVQMSLVGNDGEKWNTQADEFFRFLLAQGFILSESDLATHFFERAGEMADFRSNIPTFNTNDDEELLAGNYKCGYSCLGSN